MREYLAGLLQETDNPTRARNVVREYLHARILDLLWYLSDRDWPAPNLALLNNALAQTAWHGPEVSAESWKALIAARVQDADFGSLRQDVLPFLENPGDADLLTRKDLLGLLG